MATIRRIMANARIRLGSPRAQAPSDRQLLLITSSNIQSFLNESGASGRAWALDELNLVVQSNIEDYALPIDSSFGKAVQVRTVFPQNPAHIERDVTFTELGDLNFDWPFPKNLGALMMNYDGSPHTAQRIAFFRKSGLDQVYARVIPTPQTTATYNVLYQIGEFMGVASLDTVLLLPQHHNLITIRTCLEVLPLCEWDDNEAINLAKRKELAVTFVPLERRLTSEYVDYLKRLTVSSRLTYRNAYDID